MSFLTTETRHRPEGLRRLHVRIARVDESPFPDTPVVEESETYDPRRFAILGDSEPWEDIWITDWYPPKWTLLSPEEWVEDWRQVSSFDQEAAFEALEGALPEQLALLRPVDFGPLLHPDIPNCYRLDAVRWMGRLFLTAVQDEPTGCSVAFEPRKTVTR